MPKKTTVSREFTAFHVGVSAEAAAAALFARLGLDVSVQYGANQPEYDLVVASGDRILKVSVKGSKDGAWGLTQSFLKRAKYHNAIDQWLMRHGKGTILCFVQFKNTDVTQMPRVFLATPSEVAAHLKGTRRGRGDTILYERHEWGKNAYAAGTVDELPKTWCFSAERVETLLNTAYPATGGA